MPYKEKDDRRLTQSAHSEQWKRARRIYNHRYVLRNGLRRKAEELRVAISSSYLVEKHYSSNKMLEQINRIVCLPYAWTMEDYDHALAQLKKIEDKVNSIDRRKEKNSEFYYKCVDMFSTLAPENPQVKMTIAYDLFCNAVAENLGERVEERERSDVNLMAFMVTAADGYYPDWIPEALADKLFSVLSREDLEKICEGIKDRIQRALKFEEDKEFVNAIFLNDKVDEDNMDI